MNSRLVYTPFEDGPRTQPLDDDGLDVAAYEAEVKDIGERLHEVIRKAREAVEHARTLRATITPERGNSLPVRNGH